jgi:hypothetical protein
MKDLGREHTIFSKLGNITQNHPNNKTKLKYARNFEIENYCQMCLWENETENGKYFCISALASKMNQLKKIMTHYHAN